MLGRIDWNPSPEKIRAFAITLLIAAGVFAALLLLLGRTQAAICLLIAGAVLGTASYLLTVFGRWIYLLWMVVSYLLGQIVSPIITALIFYLVITPTAFFFRIAGKDNLRLKRNADAESYFVDHPDISDPEQFRRQF